MASQVSSQGKAVNPYNDDKPYDYSSSWIASKPYTNLLNERMTGLPDLHWFPWSIEKYINLGATDDKSCLILGSNEGWMEIALRQSGFKGRIVASDIADRALSRAKAKVEALGLLDIEHVKADLNVDTFPPGSFDYIVAEGVLHHIEKIDDCIRGLRAALNQGGRLIGSEFVGAYRFQFPELQVRWINAALRIVPRKYRSTVGEGDQNAPADDAGSFAPMSVEAMLAMDPSEAVSGHLLISALRRHFEIEILKEAGGGLIMNMGGIFPFQDANTDPDCKAWLLVMAEIERLLVEQHIVPSDLVMFVCK